MNLSSQSDVSSLWALDQTGTLWHVNTRNKSALPSLNLNELSEKCQRQVICSVLAPWRKSTFNRGVNANIPIQQRKGCALKGRRVVGKTHEA